MSNITLDEATLYYQYLINNNSTSTMLNAINGTSTDSYDALGSLSSLGGFGDVGSVLDFSTILEQYLSGVNSSTSFEDTMDAASMADKLSEVLEEAAQTEDTNSLTYKTVQELYEYFSEQVSTKAATLMGTVTKQDDTGSSTDSSAEQASASTIEQMNHAALAGQEFDFSEIDEIVDSAFAERMPMA